MDNLGWILRIHAGSRGQATYASVCEQLIPAQIPLYRRIGAWETVLGKRDLNVLVLEVLGDAAQEPTLENFNISAVRKVRFKCCSDTTIRAFLAQCLGIERLVFDQCTICDDQYSRLRIGDLTLKDCSCLSGVVNWSAGMLRTTPLDLRLLEQASVKVSICLILEGDPHVELLDSDFKAIAWHRKLLSLRVANASLGVRSLQCILTLPTYRVELENALLLRPDPSPVLSLGSRISEFDCGLDGLPEEMLIEILNGCDQLVSIKLPECEVREPILQAIAQMKMLRTVDISLCDISLIASADTTIPNVNIVICHSQEPLRKDLMRIFPDWSSD